MIRAFLGLALPDTARSALTVEQFLLPVPDRTGDRLPSESLHITLVFLGEQPEPLLADLHLSLQRLRAEDFAVSIQGLGHFGGDRPRSVHALVAPAPPLLALQAKVAQIVRRSGIAVPAQRYVPHVTLARFRTPPADTLPRLTRAIAMSRLAVAPFMAERVVLYRSDPGSRYTDLADYPLIPPAG